MKTISATLLALAAAAVLAGTVFADELRDDLLRCAQLRDAQVRLACYDALASVSASTASAASAEAESNPAGDAPAAADGEAVADGEAAAAAAGEATAAPRDPSPGVQEVAEAEPESAQSIAERFFGMLPGREAGDNRIESRVVGEIKNLRPGTRFTLENGQVWQQAEPTRRNYRATNPKVEITEGFMNSYRMRLEGLNSRIRVRRLK